jgi:hypothetical protein
VVTLFGTVPVTISVLANDSDPDGNPLTFTAATQGAHGTVTFTITSVTYTPVSTYSGTDSFTYTITLARAYPKINIFALVQGFQKRSDLVSGAASKQGTAQLERSARRAENHFRLAHPKVSNVSLRDFDFGVCLKDFTQHLQGIARKQIVRIQKRNELPPRAFQPAVARRRRFAMRLSCQAHAVSVSRKELGGIVGRTVVHHKNLKRRVGLPERAVERRANGFRGIEGGNNNTDTRGLTHGAPAGTKQPS